MSPPEFASQEAFEQYAEEQAALFRTRYGLGPTDAWEDAQIEQALADAGMPSLASLPDRPEGMMALMGRPTDPPRAWRRTNAMHLLGHVMLHGGARCEGCQDWGTD